MLGTIKIVGPEGIELAADLRKADEGTITGDLSRLLREFGSRVASKSSGVVLMLDEVPVRERGRVPRGPQCLHRGTQKNMAITLVAAGFARIPRLTGGARSYAERPLTFPVIADLPADGARAGKPLPVEPLE